MAEIDDNNDAEPIVKRTISGLGQTIIGQIETIGGVLTGDPITQAEGEFNVEVGILREKVEGDLEADAKE